MALNSLEVWGPLFSTSLPLLPISIPPKGILGADFPCFSRLCSERAHGSKEGQPRLLELE